MKMLLYSLLTVFVGTILGYFIHLDSGYVAIYYNHWTVETSLWIALFLLATFLVAARLVTRFFTRLLTLNKSFHHWKTSSSERKFQKFTLKGIKQQAEHNWKQAEKSMKKAAKHNKASVSSYLNAAMSANKQRAYQRRDDLIKTALKNSPELQPTILLTQANLQIDANQTEQAIASLLHLLQTQPHFKPALVLLYEVYCSTNNNPALVRLLPELKKHKIISTQDILSIESKNHLNQLKVIASSSFNEINAFWKKLPKQAKKNPILIEEFIKLQIENGEHAAARVFIEKSLSQKWTPSLVTLYASIPTSNYTELLSTAEKWHKKHPNDESLLYVLSRLSLRASFHQKALDYAQQLLHTRSNKKAWLLLAEINELQNNTKNAIKYYKKATMH